MSIMKDIGMVLLAMAVFTLVATSTHETIHYFQFQELALPVKDMCFMGIGPVNSSLGFSLDNTAAGWVTPKFDANYTTAKVQYQILELNRNGMETQAYWISIPIGLACMLLVFYACERNNNKKRRLEYDG
jgi:hypothetical protein